LNTQQSELIKTKENDKMATRAEVARTDNSKLGRAVLNNRAAQSRGKTPVAPAPVAAPAKKKTKTKKSSSDKD
jgi:hypothetical protein